MNARGGCAKDDHHHTPLRADKREPAPTPTPTLSHPLPFARQAEMDKHSQSSVNRAKLPTLLKEHKNDAMGRFRPRGDEATKADAKEALLVQLEKEADR